MIDTLLFVLTLLAALGCGVAAGIFFVFSNSIMTALGRLPPAGGIAAMQSINVAVINPAFLLIIFAPGVLGLVLAGAALFELPDPAALWRLGGGLVYVVGAVVVTMAFNVPRNNAIAAAAPDSAEGAAVWRRYLVEWTNWNHVRTAASLAAAAAFTIALAV